MFIGYVLLLGAHLLQPEPAKDFFIEDLEPVRGVASRIEVTERLASFQSPFQKIEIIRNPYFGKMLILDGIIQTTERDHKAYSEMMVHVPLNSHPHAKRVLIIGGGDGSLVHEALKHPEIEEVILCEIDEAVINTCKIHFPEISAALDNPRVTVIVDDAAEFIKKQKNEFDIICVDSSDPVGPNAVLFTQEFYRNIYQALAEDGIMVCQSESMYFHASFIATLIERIEEFFPLVGYYYVTMPSYPSGTIGFLFCSKKYTPLEYFIEAREIPNTMYYNKNVHAGSFMLPEFLIQTFNRPLLKLS